jgi:hypothetical protein
MPYRIEISLHHVVIFNTGVSVVALLGSTYFCMIAVSRDGKSMVIATMAGPRQNGEPTDVMVTLQGAMESLHDTMVRNHDNMVRNHGLMVRNHGSW